MVQVRRIKKSLQNWYNVLVCNACHIATINTMIDVKQILICVMCMLKRHQLQNSNDENKTVSVKNNTENETVT